MDNTPGYEPGDLRFESLQIDIWKYSKDGQCDGLKIRRCRFSRQGVTTVSTDKIKYGKYFNW